MIPVIHILSGDPPGGGGVGDYAQKLAEAIRDHGGAARIWDVRERGVRAAIERAVAAVPGWILLQYVPNALGMRGANVAFCLWLLRLRRRGCDVRVMFHEPYFYFTWRRPWRNVLAITQRAMAAILLRASPSSYLATTQWERYLRPLAPVPARFVTLPIPSTVPCSASPERESYWRRSLRVDGPLVAHFGTYGAHVTGELRPILLGLLRRRADVRVVCAGGGSEEFAHGLRVALPAAAERILATGRLASDEVAAVLRASDLAVQPYPDGITTRRTSAMAALANGVATVSSRGFLTEKVWSDTGAVRLAPASDTAAHVQAIEELLDHPEMRRGQAAKGMEVYRARFSMEHTVGALLQRAPTVA